METRRADRFAQLEKQRFVLASVRRQLVFTSESGVIDSHTPTSRKAHHIPFIRGTGHDTRRKNRENDGRKNEILSRQRDDDNRDWKTDVRVVDIIEALRSLYARITDYLLEEIIVHRFIRGDSFGLPLQLK